MLRKICKPLTLDPLVPSYSALQLKQTEDLSATEPGNEEMFRRHQMPTQVGLQRRPSPLTLSGLTLPEVPALAAQQVRQGQPLVQNEL